MRYQPYPRYAPSDVEWVGEIPDGWQELRLKFVGDAIIGLTYDPDDLTDELGGTLVLRANNIQDRKLVADAPVFVAVEAPERLRTKSGDILICSRNGSRHLIGKNAQVEGQFVGCYFGAFNTVFRSPVNAFLFHVFNSSLFEFQSGSYLTSTINQLTLGALNSFVVPLPPAPEQQQIAAFLDWKTGQIDALIGKKKELLEKLKEKRIAVITQAVTQGLNPAAPMRDSGIPWLGKVPEHWEVKRIKFIGRVGNGSTPSRENPLYWDEGYYPWLNSSVVNQEEVTVADQFVTADALAECHLPTVQPPAVLIGITGEGKTRGMATTLLIEATINQHLAYLKPNPSEAVVGFLRRVFDMAYPYLRSESDGGGSTKGAITCEQITELSIPVPPIDEQETIATYLGTETQRIDRLVEKVETAIDRLTEYRTALITAATTGKIDVRKEAIP